MPIFLGPRRRHRVTTIEYIMVDNNCNQGILGQHHISLEHSMPNGHVMPYHFETIQDNEISLNNNNLLQHCEPLEADNDLTTALNPVKSQETNFTPVEAQSGHLSSTGCPLLLPIGSSQLEISSAEQVLDPIDSRFNTLVRAIRHGNPDIFQLVLGEGIELFWRDLAGRTLMHHIAANGNPICCTIYQRE